MVRPDPGAGESTAARIPLEERSASVGCPFCCGRPMSRVRHAHMRVTSFVTGGSGCKFCVRVRCVWFAGGVRRSREIKASTFEGAAAPRGWSAELSYTGPRSYFLGWSAELSYTGPRYLFLGWSAELSYTGPRYLFLGWTAELSYIRTHELT